MACNARCSFCVIPFVRGRSRSLLRKSCAEVQQLAAPAIVKSFSAAINLGAYGRDLSPRVPIPRPPSPHPRRKLPSSASASAPSEPLDVSLPLIELIVSSQRLAPTSTCPCQSRFEPASSRHASLVPAPNTYARRVELIQSAFPHAAIGADVITGFPTRPKADHAATLRFHSRATLHLLDVFSYSQRPGTKAAALPNQVAGGGIKRRARELRALGETNIRRVSAPHKSGRTLRVLTLRRDPGDDPSFQPGSLRKLSLCPAPAHIAAQSTLDGSVHPTPKAEIFVLCRSRPVLRLRQRLTQSHAHTWHFHYWSGLRGSRFLTNSPFSSPSRKRSSIACRLARNPRASPWRAACTKIN